MEQLSYARLEDLWRQYTGEEATLSEHHAALFGLTQGEAVSFNKDQRIIIVGQGVTDRQTPTLPDRALKEYVAENPERIGLPAGAVHSVEHQFRTGDRADIVFALGAGTWAAVEIELEGEANTETGAWQAIKYRTLLCLEHNLEHGDERVSAVLVAHRVPRSTRHFCNRYGVMWFEVTLPAR